MKVIIKRILIGIFIGVIAFYFLTLIGTPILFSILFNRYESPDYLITPGVVNYSEVASEYSREEIKYKSKDNILQGYYYEVDDSNALIVMSHGIHDGADSLLAEALYFIDNGYSVFSYDTSGSSNSTGKVMGFTQSLIDLESTLNYLNSNDEYKDQKKLLFGFSWGAFASSAVLNFDIENIYGSVSISGYNDSDSLIVSKGVGYVGKLAYTGEFVVKAVQKSRFGNYVNYTAVDGINKSNLPVFIAHGTDDTVIRFNVDSIIANKNKITNPNVEYYISDGGNHTSLLYSNQAITYQNIVDNALKKMKYNEKKDYVSKVDDKLYSQLNSNLFSSILNFYNNCI